MRITSHPLRGSAAATAIRNSKALDPNARVHLRLIEQIDAAFLGSLYPGPSPASWRRWIHTYKFIEAQGREFNFVIVENGIDRGLVRMHDFADIRGEASFGWGDFVCTNPGLLTAAALSIYTLGFHTLGYGRAHMAVPNASPDIVGFHLNTGATLEFEDDDHSYFRFDSNTYDQVRNDAIRRRMVTMPENV